MRSTNFTWSILEYLVPNTNITAEAKYLAKLLLPLSQSISTINNTKYFIEEIKNVEIPSGYEVVSFDVKALFT